MVYRGISKKMSSVTSVRFQPASAKKTPLVSSNNDHNKLFYSSDSAIDQGGGSEKNHMSHVLNNCCAVLWIYICPEQKVLPKRKKK